MGRLFAAVRSGPRGRSFFRPAVEALEGRTLLTGGLPQATAAVAFRMGRMVADPARDLVYVADLTDGRVLAVDTDLGQTVAGRALASAPGALAVSPDGSRLFVAESSAFQVQVLSLPDLQPLGVLPVGIEVDNLAATVNGHLFASTPGHFGGSAIDELDAGTGAVLGRLSQQYLAPLLRTNPAGTKLYIREDDSGSGNDGSVDEYDVSGPGQPSKTNTYPAQGGANSQDFLVDESARRVYTMDGGVYGVGVTDTDSKAQTVWSFGGGAAYGFAVASLPGGPVFGAAGSGGIFQFDAGGHVTAQYSTPFFGVAGEALKITPNGHLLYGGATGSDTSRFGILGATSLVIDALPVARFTYTAGGGGQVSFDAGTSSAGLPGRALTGYTWDFGDGTAGSGATITHTFGGRGPFTVALTVTNSAGQTDAMSLSVLPTSSFPQPTATADVNFRVGRMVADPVRDLVYAADLTHNRILAVDTDLGQTVARQALAAAPGALAVSPDGGRLFVAEPQAQQIQVMSLPDLRPVAILAVGFEVDNLVATANDHLFVNTSGAAVDELDALTGQVLAAFSVGYQGLLRTNPAGTKLYLRGGANVDEYDVGGPGAPAKTNTYAAQPGDNSQDFLVDESARRVYTMDGGVYGVGVADTDTGARTVWSFGGAPYGFAVASLPGGPVYADSGGGIFQFDAGGTIRAHYPAGRAGESLKESPNGHLLYASATGANSSEFGILGATSLFIDDTPLASFTFSLANGGVTSFDASASLPGQPGETLTGYAWDFGDGTTGGGATVTHTFHGDGPFTVTLTVTSPGGQTDSSSVPVSPRSAVPLAQATAGVNFRVGRMVADPVRDLVYVADLTHQRVLAVDTDRGQTVARQALAGAPGALAVSPDGTRLFVAEPKASQVQVLSLPGLQPVAVLPVGIEVDNLAATVNNHLFVSTPGNFGGSAIDVVDAQTGAVLGQLPTGYLSPLLRTNPAGTKLYVREDGNGSGNDGSVDEYDVSGPGAPAKSNNYPAQGEQNSQDFLVDESARRVYTMDGGVYGVGVTDTDSKARTVWSFGGAAYGLAVAALPGGPVFAASGDGGIFEFDAGGIIRAQYPAGVAGESLKITPNGHLLYASATGANSSEFGILGAPGLFIDDTPLASFTFSLANGGVTSFDASASLPGQPGETLTGYAWDFGDGTTGSGVSVTHTFTENGPFTVKLTVTSSTGQTDSSSVPVTPRSAVPLAQATADVNFQVGRMVADPVRDLVYVADLTHNRILAVDTDRGRTVSRRALAAAPGALAVSPRGDQLFVAEPGALQIQVLSLPDLKPVNILRIRIEVDNLAAAVNDHLFASTPGDSGGSAVDELDARTGKVLGQLSQQYLAPLLRTNPAGTRIYLREDDGGSGADGSVDEYDVSGPGAPAKTKTYPAQTQANSQDFLVDASARRVYTMDGGVYGVGVTDMDTGAQTVWSFGGAPYGYAVAALPGGPVFGASGGGIFEFDTGGVVRAQYPTPAGVAGEALKETPNGHLLYASATGANSSEFGILGAPGLFIDDTPLASFTFSLANGGVTSFDASASLSGQPGETLTGYAWNFGDGTAGSGVTITHTFHGPGPFTVKLTVTSPGGQTDSLAVPVSPRSAMPLAQATADVNFQVGRMVADPVRDLVYVADLTHQRVLAVDTDRGRVVARRDLAAAPGALAVSPDGGRLFVAEPGASQIQALSLPGLKPLKTLAVGFPVGNLVAIANDHLAVSTSAEPTWSGIDILSAQTGAVLTTVSGASYYAPLFRTNAAGTRLYVRDIGVSGPDRNIDVYRVSGAGPVALINGYPAPLENSEDFIVDEAARRIYTADGGVYGVGVTSMGTKAETVWSFDGASYGFAVAALPGGPVFAASGDGIFEFDSGGVIRAQYPTPVWVAGEALKETPNGHLLYASATGDNSSEFGILGAPGLVIDDVPVARFTFTPGPDGRVFFDASISVPGFSGQALTSYIWDFGDGTTGRGAKITHTFARPGPYTVRLTVTNSTGQTDVVSVSVPGGSVTVPKAQPGKGGRQGGRGPLTGPGVTSALKAGGRED